MSFDSDIRAALALFLPILAANQGAWTAEGLKLPLYRVAVSRKWLGNNKTLAPYYMGPLLAMAILFGYHLVYENIDWFREGAVLGLGAVLGDHIKSFVKRSLNRPPGSKWIFDRIDFAIGGGVAAWWYYDWVTWVHVLYIVLLAWPVHYFGNHFSYSRGWRKTPH